MRKYILTVVLCAAMLAAGCASGESSTTIHDMGVGTTAAEETSAGEGTERFEEYLAAQESLGEEIADLREEIESLRVLMESYVEDQGPAGGAWQQTASTEETVGGAEPDLSYRGLLRSGNEYVGMNVTFSGTVIQSVPLNSSTMQLLMAVDGDDSTMLVGEFPADLIAYSLGNDDEVTVTGRYKGVIRYVMGTGERVELPSITISELTRDGVAESHSEILPSTSASSETTGSSGPGDPSWTGPGYGGSGSSDPGPVKSGPGVSGSAGSGPGSSGSGSGSSGPGASGPGSSSP